MKKSIHRLMMLVMFIVFLIQGFSQEHKGTLIFRVLNYETNVRLKDNITKQLKHAALEWCIFDNTLIITQVSQKFVKLTNPKRTLFGEEEKLELPPGVYTVTCIGYQPRSSSSNIDKVLTKSAYFNLEILSFNILPEKTTQLIILPIYQKQETWGLTMYVPDYHMKIFEDGKEITECQINKKTEKSILWDNYTGPLKFE